MSAINDGRDSDDIWTYDDVERWLKLPRATVRSDVMRGRIPHFRLGPRTVRFSRTALEQWLAERQRGVR